MSAVTDDEETVTADSDVDVAIATTINESQGKKDSNTQTKPKDASDKEYTPEQKIVSAVWMHEREFNLHSMEKIKQNFKTRFGIEAPDPSVLEVWEKKLFEHGYIDKPTSSDREMSEEGSDEDGSDDNSDEESE
ncbi:unnamed protein product [Acanthoscelides obtectus]|uniref:Uncharacterized protein n=1 Tax=Acanthoscelides obtectus TaxID=200917 RepID=A0A9P0JJH5_ACAOB|nr:unnamed protein product [Acanthoscelides obtectus]CAK1661308.1 hypothetical protein AOBTE_LOCUS22561 [Acanthoscelides obtectus]